MTDAVLVEHGRPGHRADHAEPARAAQRDELRRSSRGLYDALDELADDRSCRVIVLTGAGRGFCAGLDLTEGASPPGDAGIGPRAGRA